MADINVSSPGPTGSSPGYTLGDLVRYALRLGACGFGGPVALVGFMHRDLVERRQWISEAEYKEGLTLSQIMPGPLASQLAIYLGYVHYGVLGATLVGIGFVLPSFLMVLALGWAYVSYGGLPWMQAVFYGVGAAVIGIITISASKLTQKTVGQNPLLWAIYLTSAVATIITETEQILLFLAAGAVVWFARVGRGTPPAAAALGLVPPVFGTVPPVVAVPLATLYGQIALFFTKAGAFVFGSGLAIVPFLYGGAVKEYGWLDDRQFLDAVALLRTDPTSLSAEARAAMPTTASSAPDTVSAPNAVAPRSARRANPRTTRSTCLTMIPPFGTKPTANPSRPNNPYVRSIPENPIARNHRSKRQNEFSFSNANLPFGKL